MKSFAQPRQVKVLQALQAEFDLVYPLRASAPLLLSYVCSWLFCVIMHTTSTAIVYQYEVRFLIVLAVVLKMCRLTYATKKSVPIFLYSAKSQKEEEIMCTAYL